MDWSTWGFSVLHYHLEFAQTHVHWVNDAIQPSYPLLPPSPPPSIFSSIVVMHPKAHLNSHSRMSGSRWVTTPLWLFASLRVFVQFCVFLPPLNLYCFCEVHTISVLYPAHLYMKCSFGISKFLKIPLVFPILLFSSISLHCSLNKAFLFILAILWNCVFSWVYFPYLLCILLLFFSQRKTSSDNHFTFLHFFFLGMVLVTTSCTMLWTSVHSSSGTLSNLIPWIYLSLSLYNHK